MTRVRTSGGVLLTTLAACSPTPSEVPPPPNLQGALEASADNSIVPGFVAFDAAVRDLADGTSAFCSAPDRSGLEDLQGRWRALSLTWNRVAPFGVGPLFEDLIFPSISFIESMRPRGTDYTDTVRDELGSALAGSMPLDDAYFEGLAFNRVGLLALEVLLFEDATPTRSRDVATIAVEYASLPRKCLYLQGMARLLAGRARRVLDGWTTSYLDTGRPFRDLFVEGALEDGTEPVPALLVAIIEHLDYVKRRKLEGILDARLSGHFYPNVLATLESVEGLLTQDATPGAAGFLDVVEAQGFSDRAAAVEATFSEAMAAAQAEDRAGLAEDIGTLEGLLRREVPDALRVTLGVTFSDGD